MTITEFLEARLAADEERCTLTPGGTFKLTSLDGGTEADEEAVQQYYHRFQPEWMARDLAAKRKIVDQHALDEAGIDEECGLLAKDGPCLTLRYLGSAYADHPDYDQDWLP